ncbi:MAG: hypothetical protein ABII88_06490 [Candidatus Omnitrophota bacterium]
MKKIASDFKAVVIGLYPTSLGIIRSLVNKGVKVIGVESDRNIPGAYTRLCQVENCQDINDDKFLVETLISFAKRESKKPVLFLTGDENVQIASKNRKELLKYYKFSLPEADIVEMLMEKTKFAKFAEKEKLKVPRSVIFKEIESLSKIINDFQFPCIVKPSYKTHAWEHRFEGNKAYFVNKKEELFVLLKEKRKYCNDLIVQEWIPGDDSNVYFCLMYYGADSKLKTYFTGRKLLQWLPGTGSTCVAESVDLDIIKKMSVELFDKVQYRGLGSAEFKKDDRTGEFKITEPTVGRSNLQSAIALLQGINMPFEYYCEMIGESSYAGNHKRKKVIWINEDYCLKYIYKHGIKDFRKNKIFRKAIFLKKGFAYFNIFDIKPFLIMIYQALCLGAKKIKWLQKVQ